MNAEVPGQAEVLQAAPAAAATHCRHPRIYGIHHGPLLRTGLRISLQSVRGLGARHRSERIGGVRLCNRKPLTEALGNEAHAVVAPWAIELHAGEASLGEKAGFMTLAPLKIADIFHRHTRAMSRAP